MALPRCSNCRRYHALHSSGWPSCDANLPHHAVLATGGEGRCELCGLLARATIHQLPGDPPPRDTVAIKLENFTPPKQLKCRLCELQLFLDSNGTRPVDIFGNQPKTEDLIYVDRVQLYDNNRHYTVRYVFCNRECFRTYLSWDPTWRDAKPVSNASIESMYNDPDPYKAPPVDGFCPMGCGAKLALSEDSRVYCQNPTCPDQHAVHTIMSDPETEHVVTIADTGWDIKHPLRERVGDKLLGCAVHRFLGTLSSAPLAPGNYRVTRVHDEWIWTPLP